VDGTVRAPPSKSQTQRAVLLAALAKGESRISNPSRCDDVLASMRLARSLGAEVAATKSGIIVMGSLAGGMSRTVDCGGSAFCLRAGSAIVALSDGTYTLTGTKQLLRRPLGGVEVPLASLGARCSSTGGYPPVTVKGPIKGGHALVDCSATTQFASGLAMAIPLAELDSSLTLSGLRGPGYVTMTLESVRAFGGDVEGDLASGHLSIEGGQSYSAAKLAVEGDWSGASFMLVAGAIGGSVKVTGLLSGSLQPDTAIIDALRLAGASVREGPSSVACERDMLEGFAFDVSGCPDLLPPLAALATSCKGRSEISGVRRTRTKESDRASVLASELTGLGARVRLEGDRLVVNGGGLKGGHVDSHGDHRIAMAGAVAALGAEGQVTIAGTESVSKSYPDFFGDLRAVVKG
jgi:3-phosphoshikimate 1-carboxyvinyltransferase